MVRQLEPTENGLPIEVYCFSKNMDWVEYERIQADIFDHLLSSVSTLVSKYSRTPQGSLVVKSHLGDGYGGVFCRSMRVLNCDLCSKPS